VSELVAGREFTWVSWAPGMRVTARHSVCEGRAVLSLRYEGLFGPWLARRTREITERYLALEAEGLKRRSEELAPAVVASV
jgi:hypothetical protein